MHALADALFPYTAVSLGGSNIFMTEHFTDIFQRHSRN